MSEEHLTEFRLLEGRAVSIALTDGSRIDDCQLVSAGRHGVASLWIFVNGVDMFIPVSEVLAVWEPNCPACRKSRVA